MPRWKKHAPATIELYGEHDLLRMSDALLESVMGRSNCDVSYEPATNPSRILFGSTLPYARAHDKPRGTYTRTGHGAMIPGRPWSEVTQNNIDSMRDIVMNWTRQKLAESGFKGR
jgi:hypothetical protein